MGFIDRARLRLRKFIDRAGIMVVASHNTDMLREWCNKAMVLEHGKLVGYGPLEPMIAQYAAAQAKSSG